MIRREFNIEGYWRVVVYYNVNYNFFATIAVELKSINISNQGIYKVYNNMRSGKAKAVTVTNNELKTSIVLINKHDTRFDYINTIIHEAEHIKQHMLKAYNVPDRNEPPAYTVGYIATLMLVK